MSLHGDLQTVNTEMLHQTSVESAADNLNTSNGKYFVMFIKKTDVIAIAVI